MTMPQRVTELTKTTEHGGQSPNTVGNENWKATTFGERTRDSLALIDSIVILETDRVFVARPNAIAADATGSLYNAGDAGKRAEPRDVLSDPERQRLNRAYATGHGGHVPNMLGNELF